MLLKSNNKTLVVSCVILLCVLKFEIAACYKNEIEITPAPIEETTTKKSGFFSGIKKFFGSSATTTTTIKPSNSQSFAPTNTNNGPQKPPPLQLATKAPLMPLGPRPDTPLTSPLAGNHHAPPQWPQVSTSTTVSPILPDNKRTNGSPQLSNLPHGVKPFIPPSKQQPSGVDLSYGNKATSAPQSGPGFGLAPITSSTTARTTTSTTTTTTPRSPLQNKEQFPSLPPPRKPSSGAKDDFPALPTPKSSSSFASSTTTKRPASPSAWNTPNIPNSDKFYPTPTKLPPSETSTTSRNQNHGVSFVTHGTSTTVRPGFENTGNKLATDEEIMALTETLYTKENNEFSEIHVNIQGKTRSIDSTDEAPKPLLEIDSKYKDSNTVSKMRLLFNNYESDTSVNEHVTANEHKEENDFVDAVMATSVMRQAMLFLQNKGIVSPDPKTHRDLIKEIWFTQYSRGQGKIGSSGFEHVFLYEVKNGTLIGLHNWVFFAEEEKAGRLDYQGYLKTLNIGNRGQIVKMRFKHNNVNKPVNGLFIGTSPELELALYTICFKLRADRTCPVSLGSSKFGVVTYSWRYRGKNLIGSAFPEI